uniref:Uncharacterized protein n=1 Tax=Arundo donax TaxID=35708 RepID=A0A0A9BTN6_ARUDO
MKLLWFSVVFIFGYTLRIITVLMLSLRYNIYHNDRGLVI